VTKKGEKKTTSGKTRKLTLGKKTLKDLGAKNVGGVKGGESIFCPTYGGVCTALSKCRLQCHPTASLQGCK
jgi:hypothetical protein